MNFLCGDETYPGTEEGHEDTAAKGDAFVMCGLMLNVEAFFKTAAAFDRIFASMHKSKFINKSEFKSSKFWGGSKERVEQNQKVHDEKKKKFRKFCDDVSEMNVEIFAVGISIEKIAKMEIAKGHSKESIARILGGIFISDLIQEKAANAINGDHERTLVIFDEHYTNANIGEILREDVSLQDWINQTVKANNAEPSEFTAASIGSADHIVDRKFYEVDSTMSLHVQAADALCYVYRRYLDMWDGKERWDGERTYINKLVGVLDQKRYMLKSPDNLKCVELFKAIEHRGWKA